MMNYYSVSKEDLLQNSRIPLSIFDNPYEIFIEFALEMANEIISNNGQNKHTVLICPCGPTEQYPIFARIVNMLNINLKNTWIINMDEYLNEDGTRISSTDEFSFRSYMERYLYSQIRSDLIMPENQRIFPDPTNLEEIPELIDRLNGVDIAFGGVALNGHIAFNEPHPELDNDTFKELPTRIVTLSPETRIKDAILSRGGAIDTVPTTAITIGMKEILGAKKIRLSMMNQMQRAIIRKACLADISTACPVSFLQNHPDAKLLVNSIVAEKPF